MKIEQRNFKFRSREEAQRFLDNLKTLRRECLMLETRTASLLDEVRSYPEDGIIVFEVGFVTCNPDW